MIISQIVLVLVTVPFAQRTLPPLPGFLPIYWTLAFAFETLTAYLLLIQFRVSRRPMLAALAGAYAFGGTIVIPHALSFPDALFHGAALGNDQTSVWAWAIWHGGFPLLIALALLVDLRRHEPIPQRWVVPAALGALITGYALVVLATMITFHFRLWTLVNRGNFADGFGNGVWEVVLIIDIAALIIAVLIGRTRSVLSLWVGVALVAALCDAGLTLISGGRYHVGWYLSRLYSIFASGFVFYALLAEFNGMYTRFARLATIDGLTGVDNRRAFDDRIDVELRDAARSGEPLSLLMLDVDDFKRYNDAYGHVSGDQTLRLVANVARDALVRPADTISRYGGEEFALLLPRTTLGGAIAVAERVRSSVHDLQRAHIGNRAGPYVTVSIGVATTEAGTGSVEQLIKRADAALYDAKGLGRDRVAYAPAFAAPAENLATA